MTIQKNQIYTLPSKALVQVKSLIEGDDWNCLYLGGGDSLQITLSAAFLRKFGEVWA